MLNGDKWGIVVLTMLVGSFTRSVDEKLRVAIPKSFREAMDCPQGGVLYIAPGFDHSLAIYTEESFAQLGERLAQRSPTRHQVREFARLFYAAAQRVKLDRQGRIRIPAELAELAGLGAEAKLLGVRDHLELWAADRWETYRAEKQPHYDEIAEAAFDEST